MTPESSYNASTINRDIDTEVQRLRAQVLLSWEKEARTLGWFGLQDGMKVLELGSGPGFYTEQLLNLLPNSSVTALEIDPVLVEKASQHLQGKTDDRLSIVQASVMDTGLPDNSFDFAIARFLFCHLPDPVNAAKEVFRVLKPGGKLAIVDFDLDLFTVQNPFTPGWQAFQDKIIQIQASRGGNPLIGRQLLRLLKKAGFQHVDLEAVVSHSDASGLEGFLAVLDPGLVLQLGKLGLLSQQEIESFMDSQEKFQASPNPLMMLLWFMACGQKP